MPLRATFIADPEGVIRFASVNDLTVGRNIVEVLRVLDALQIGELCPSTGGRASPRSAPPDPGGRPRAGPAPPCRLRRGRSPAGNPG